MVESGLHSDLVQEIVFSSCFIFILFLLKITLSYKFYLQSRNACICRLKGDPDTWALWLLWVEIFQFQPLHTIQKCKAILCRSNR